MTIAELTVRMIEYSKGNLHDICHFMKVYGYAKTIGELEKLDRQTQDIVEAAALVHDIACPLCREKYGNTNGKHQEQESEPLVREFFRETGFPEPFIDRVCYLVSHHHSPDKVDGMDYQILLEADYLVNADESHFSRENVEHTLHTMFKTQAGTRMLRAVYLNEE